MREAVPIIGERRRRAADWPLKAWASVIVIGVGAALILAVLLVIASRLAGIESTLRKQAGADELARTRYEAEMQQLHRLEVSFNTMAAWYQEDIRRQDDLRLLMHGKR